MTAVVRYPHSRPSLRPLALSTAEMALIARSVRDQVCAIPHRPKVDLPSVMRRLRYLTINDVNVELLLRVEPSLVDERGVSVLGLTEHDPQSPSQIRLALNGGLIADDEPLATSTLMHEIAHAIFDAPEWVTDAKQCAASQTARQRYLRAATFPALAVRCWSEWRANEFMGAFLAPRSLLHQWMVKRAAAFEVPMDSGGGLDELPIIYWSVRHADRIEAVILDLAMIFGLSVSFIETRLAKYQLMRAR